MESAGLMSVCLKKIPGLNNGKAKIIDAAWVWTEPHSKRLKISVEFEAGILDDKVKLRQKTIVEFVIKNKQCLQCITEATDHSWGCMIQVTIVDVVDDDVMMRLHAYPQLGSYCAQSSYVTEYFCSMIERIHSQGHGLATINGYDYTFPQYKLLQFKEQLTFPFNLFH